MNERRITRRLLLSMIPSMAVAAAARGRALQQPSTRVRPFKIAIPQSTITRILRQVKQARWPDRLESADWRYGANWDYMKSLADYWVGKYDWRTAEGGLNRYPQFLAKVGDFDVHF